MTEENELEILKNILNKIKLIAMSDKSDEEIVTDILNILAGV